MKNEQHVDLDRVKQIVHEHLNSSQVFGTIVDHIRRFLQPDPFADAELTNAVLHNVFTPTLDRAAANIERLLTTTSTRPVTPLQQEHLDRIIAADLALARARTRLGANALHEISEAAAIINDALPYLRTDPPLNRERLREVALAANDLLRIGCLVDVRNAMAMLEASNQQLRLALRHLKGERLADFADIHDLRPIVQRLMKQWETAAAKRDIQLQYFDYAVDARVAVPLHGLETTINNLLDNAIKYTGKLSQTHYPFLWIKLIIRSSAHTVTLAVESWGTPITEEELRDGTLFAFNRRGHFVDSGQIPGTGAGLYYARQFATRYDGNILIDTNTCRPTDTPKPTTTTVTLILPRRRD